HFAGDMVFTAELVDGRNGGKFLKSTSEPAPAPPEGSLPQPLALPGRTAPRVLILDTGLRTVVTDDDRRPEHEYLQLVRVHVPWVAIPTEGAIDAREESD